MAGQAAEFVRIEITGAVARVTLNRPALHNAFNEVMIGELREVFERLAGDSSNGQISAPSDFAGVRAVVLSGEGKSFSAGGDLNWMGKMVDYSFEENLADAEALSAMYSAIRNCPKPVIARIHGAAFGGGVGLAAACDIAIATESATFCLSETKLGLLPAVISPFVLEKIGPGAARRYFLTAERFSAAEALRIGLISEVVADDATLDARIDALTQAIAANGPEAVALSKRLIDEVCAFDWPQATAITARRIAEKRISPEGQEGIRAFLEKRPPKWGGEGTAPSKG